MRIPNNVSVYATEPLRLKEQGWWKRGKRSISKQQYVEALLVADASMVEYHQDGDVETYLLTIMNMVTLDNINFVWSLKSSHLFLK